MGCGSSVVTVVQHGATVRSAGHGTRDDDTHTLPPVHEESEEGGNDHHGGSAKDSVDDCDRISQASSAGRTISSYVSGKSTLYSKQHLHSKSARSDDMQSDVPTIAESIADMQDLIELCGSSSNHFMSSERNQGGSFGFGSIGSFGIEPTLDFGPMIDNRPHPLAPAHLCIESMTEASQGTVVGMSDLGLMSDVPSMRDDISISSSADEIQVLFPNRELGGAGSPSCSELGSGITPTNAQARLSRTLQLAMRDSEGSQRSGRSGRLVAHKKSRSSSASSPGRLEPHWNGMSSPGSPSSGLSGARLQKRSGSHQSIQGGL